MPPIVERIAVTVGNCALAIYFLLGLWTGVREWRQFLFAKRYAPVPRWIEYLIRYLWLLAVPSFAEDLVHSWPHVDTKSLFVAGVFAFYLALGLASRWIEEKRPA